MPDNTHVNVQMMQKICRGQATGRNTEQYIIIVQAVSGLQSMILHFLSLDSFQLNLLSYTPPPLPPALCICLQPTRRSMYSMYCSFSQLKRRSIHSNISLQTTRRSMYVLYFLPFKTRDQQKYILASNWEVYVVYLNQNKS